MSSNVISQDTRQQWAFSVNVLPTKRRLSWKVYGVVTVLTILAATAVIPYSLTISSTSLDQGELARFTFSTVVNVVIICVLASAGLFLASRIGLGLPFLESWLKKEPAPDNLRGVLILSAIAGISVSLVVLALSTWFFAPLVNAELDALGITLPAGNRPALWQGFLASFYGGISEEMQLRLFLMTVLAWLGSRVSRDNQGRPTPAVLWCANFLAAILFGLGHLPATAAMGLPMSPAVIANALVLNGIGGLVFGWLYWRKGLESAVIAHFCADIVLHVILPAAAMLLAV